MGLVDVLTCRGNGLVNLNTAPRTVLETLPISRDAVEAIIAYRAFDEHAGGNLEEDHAFRSVTDIRQLQGLTGTDRDVLERLAQFRSQHFRVFVQATHLPTGLRYDLDVLVRMRGDKSEIIQWKVGR
jgi:hypothetical protein